MGLQSVVLPYIALLIIQSIITNSPASFQTISREYTAKKDPMGVVRVCSHVDGSLSMYTTKRKGQQISISKQEIIFPS
jgi:hypothetical protein